MARIASHRVRGELLYTGEFELRFSRIDEPDVCMIVSISTVTSLRRQLGSLMNQFSKKLKKDPAFEAIVKEPHTSPGD